MKNNNNSWDNFVNSSIATVFAELATVPICTTKTHYQNTESTSVINIVKKLYSENGIEIFFRASGFSIFSQIISTSSKFVIYRHLNTFDINYTNHDLTNKMTTGAISGILSSIITHPIEFGKINTQMKNSVIDKIKNQGLVVVYRGYSKTFVKAGVGSSLFFPLYDFYNNKLNNAMCASFSSAISSTLILHPIDYAKTRHVYGLPWFNGLNPLVYYKGMTLNLARTVPHFMLTMTIIDYLEKKLLRKH